MDVHTGKICYIDHEMRLYNEAGAQSVTIMGTLIRAYKVRA